MGNESTYHFGEFTFDSNARILRFRGTPVTELGSRAIGLLHVLLANAGQTVAKATLIRAVWPHTFVEPTNLRVHMSALRKVLAMAPEGADYLSSVPGVGYRFTSAVIVEPTAPERSDFPEPALPVLPAARRLVGRQADLAALQSHIQQHRLLTITGAGGVGKTAVAVNLAHLLHAQFAEGVLMVDLAALNRGDDVAAALGNAMNVSSVLTRIDALVLMRVERAEILLILDNCEHIREGVAQFCQTLLHTGTRSRVVVTSREPLACADEYVYRLAPLPSPRLPGVTSDQLWQYPAVQLFVERAGSGQTLDPDKIQQIGAICNVLDGLPLAIELVAARAELIGLGELHRQIDTLSLQGAQTRRTSLIRHQSLRAMIAWSFELLAPLERILLCNVAVFRRDFELGQVAAVCDRPHDPELEALVDGLVAKNLLVAVTDGIAKAYRILEIPRAFALEQLRASNQYDLIMQRFARFCLAALPAVFAQWSSMMRTRWCNRYRNFADEVRNLIEWSIAGGDHRLGLQLTARTYAFAARFSFFQKWRSYVAWAVAAPEFESLDDRDKVDLYTCLMWTSHFSRYNHYECGEALAEALDLAFAKDDPQMQIKATMIGFSWAFGLGAYPMARDFMEQFATHLRRAGTPDTMVTSHRMRCQLLHFGGAQNDAILQALTLMEGIESKFKGDPHAVVNMNPKVALGIVLTRAYWLTGEFSLAWQWLERTFTVSSDEAIARCQVLAFAACPVALWSGEWGRASNYLRALRTLVTDSDMVYWQTWLRMYEHAVARRSGPASQADARFAVDLEVEFGDSFSAKVSDHLATFDERWCGATSMFRVQRNAVGWCAPEIKRIEAVRSAAAGRTAEAHRQLDEAADLAHRQGANFWAVRIALSRVQFAQPGHDADLARQLLKKLLNGITDPGGGVDLLRARACVAQPVCAAIQSG